MPGKVKVKIISGKNLPVMDRSSDTTDAYVELKLGNTTYKTDVCRRTLNPQWNTDWYKFEVDDSELQDEPLQIRLMDHDTYSANDAIGKVYLNLNPLLLPVARQLDVGDNNPHHEISGWIPVFDTMHGIRGEVNVTVKVQLFSDSNRFRQSSCGVHFFYSPTVPQGYQAKVINGFVEELIVDDDPEYQWIDKIRTPRASNEARQTLFFKLSGELQRKIGVKALSLGGNAVIGYRQCFDLEGESGIVARGIGTAVTLVKVTVTNFHHISEAKEEDLEKYVKFVGDGKSFSLCPKSPTHTRHFPFFLTAPIEAHVRLPKLAKRQYASFDSHLISPSASNPNLHEPHIKRLLNQEDSRGKSVMFGRFQKFKHSQKSLSKKMIALKAKINDSIGEEGDEASSLPDKRRHFKRSSSDSSAMAEILARSVMKATTSLTCILEDQPHAPKEEETLEKLQPIANLLNQSAVPESGLDEAGSDCSSSESSSTCSEYDYGGYRRGNTDVETLSNIITNVEKLQRCLSTEGLHKQYSMPAIPTKGFSLSSLDDFSRFDSSYTFDSHMIGEPRRSKDSLGMSELSISSSNVSHLVEPYPPIRLERRSSDIYDSRAGEETKKPSKLVRSHEIDLSEEAETLSVSTTMLSNSLPTKVFERSKIFTVDPKALFRSSSHIFRKSPARKSTSSKSVDHIHSEAHGLVKTALQTMLVDRAESLGAPVTEIPTTHQGSTKKEIESRGIVKTALQTMLVERADLLGASKESESPKGTVWTPKENLAPNDPSPKGIVDTALKTMLVERADMLGAHKEEIIEEVKSEPSSKGIVNTALKTMLFERAELMNSSPEVERSSKEFSPEKNGVLAPVSLENVTVEPKKMVKTAMQTMLLDKFNILGTYTPPTSPNLDDSHAGTNFTFSHAGPTRKTIPKSSSTSSFGGKEKQKETVLGMPFTSLSSLVTDYDEGIKQQRKKFFLDGNSPEDFSHELRAKANRKKRFKFLLSKPDDNEKTGHSVFDRIRRLSKRNIHDDFTRIFALRHEGKDKSTQTSLESLSNPSPNSKTETKITIITPKPPGNTDLASGDFLAHSKTKCACITSHQSPPAQERQEQNCTERKNEPSPDPPGKVAQSPVKMNYMVPIHRRSSDSDLSITPKGNSLTGSDKSAANVAAYFMRNNYIRRGQLNQDHFDLLEYPFLTMTKFPHRFILQIGGSISARSVKLLERILNQDEPESRDIWWSEIRMEIRSHARSLNCNAVLGYSESTSICDDVCVLSACGTAAVIDLSGSAGDDDNFSNVQLIHKNVERDKQLNGHHKTSHDSPDHKLMPLFSCFITHLPYDEKIVPLKAKVSKCPMCIKGRVPEVLISTIEPPDSLPIVGRGCFIESHVSRPLKDLRGETFAKEISDGLPFLEYELHRLLVNKLKIKGMNAVFSLKIRISVGDKMMVGVATGTAVYLPCLPSPEIPLLVTDRVADKKLVAELQEVLHQTVKKNREIYQIMDDTENQKSLSDDESDGEPGSLDISCGNKDCCILEMDDPEDAEVLRLLMQEKVPDGFHVVNTESVPGLDDLEIVKNLQMFTQIYRAKLVPPYNLQNHFVRLLQSVYFKLRRMVPCALCDLQFRIDVPEPDEIQLCVIGMALGLGKKGKKANPAVGASKKEDDLIFKLDEDSQENSVSQVSKSNTSSLKYRNTRSPAKYRPPSLKQRHIPAVERHGVDITPLSYVPGGIIEQYLGNLNFFFIRETTSIREEGGLSGFIHSFITEVLAIVRSHVTALGGNALVAFFMTECVLNHNLHKNQGQCLINVGGDVVSVSYIKNDV